MSAGPARTASTLTLPSVWLSLALRTVAAFADMAVDLEERHVHAVARGRSGVAELRVAGSAALGAHCLCLRSGAATWLLTMCGVSGAW